jgi:CRISPR-associated protein Cas2
MATRPQPDKPNVSTRRRRQWLVVSYDIADDRRRHKVMRIVGGYGRRVQYSVFECEVRPAQVLELQQRLRRVIRPEQDSVRFYLLCEECLGKVVTLGLGDIHRVEPMVLI